MNSPVFLNPINELHWNINVLCLEELLAVNHVGLLQTLFLRKEYGYKQEAKPSDIYNEINLSNINCREEHSNKWELFVLPRI